MTSAAFNNKNTKLVTGTEDGKIYLWNILTWTNIVCVNSHKAAIFSLNFCFNDLFVITASDDSEVKIIDSKTGE